MCSVREALLKYTFLYAQPSANDGPPIPPRSPIATRSYSVGQEPAIIDKRESTVEPLEQLLSRCLYTAKVLVDYYWDSSPFGDQFSLKVCQVKG